MNPETNQENTKITAYLNIDYLLSSNYDWKKIVRDDLLNFQNKQEDLEMLELIKEYYQIMAEVMYEIKKQFLDLNHKYLLSVEKQNNPASKCHSIPAVFFKKMGQLSDRICLFQHVCQFRPADCLLQ